MKCPHCKKFLFFFERVIEEIYYCPFCGKKIQRIDDKHFGMRKAYLNQTTKVGDTIRFGIYLQEKEIPTIIEWSVLDRREDYILLISQKALDCRKFSEKGGSALWTDSALRKWLNGEFLTSAFSEDRCNNIMFTRIDDHQTILTDSPISHGIDELLAHYDRIFLLSRKDIEHYCLKNDSLKRQPTSYSISHGTICTKDNNCYWWTQSPSTIRNNIQFITPAGDICEYGSENITLGNVVPAMWIRI